MNSISNFKNCRGDGKMSLLPFDGKISYFQSFATNVRQHQEKCTYLNYLKFLFLQPQPIYALIQVFCKKAFSRNESLPTSG
jgi:hypothetical protein